MIFDDSDVKIFNDDKKEAFDYWNCGCGSGFVRLAGIFSYVRTSARGGAGVEQADGR